MIYSTEDNLTAKHPYFINHKKIETPDLYNKLHKHSAVEIIYVEKGNMSIIIDYQIYPLNDGDIVFINSSVPHSLLIYDDKPEIYYTQFLPELSYSYGDDFFDITYFYWMTTAQNNSFAIYSTLNDNTPVSIIKDAFKVYDEKNFFSDSYILARILLICVWFFNKWCAKNKSNLPEITYTDVLLLKNIYSKVSENHHEISIDEICEKIYLSADSALKQFKKLVGCSFRKYIENYKILYGKFLLATTSMRVTEIAYAVGFSDSSYFSTQFKNNTGFTPSEFRKKQQISHYLKEAENVEKKCTPALKEDITEDGNKAEGKRLFYSSIFLSAYYDDYVRKSWITNDFYEIIYCDMGQFKIDFDEETYILSSGDCLLVAPHERHKLTNTIDNSSILWIQFYPEILNIGNKKFPFIEELLYVIKNKKRFFSISPDTDIELLSSLVMIFDEKFKFEPSSEVIIRANIINALSHIIEKQLKNNLNYNKDAQNKLSRKFDDIIDYISSNYTDDFTLEFIANKFYINYSYLSRKFKERTHQRFSSYINTKRLMKARFLLATTTYSITDIAKMLGFCSRSRFAERFIKYTKVSPTEFRRMFKTKSPLDKSYLDIY